MIQFGIFDAKIEELKLKFSTLFNTEVIGTEDEKLCNKALLYEKFKLKVENGNIVDVIPRENLPLPEQIPIPTIEERLTVAEDTINFLLGL